MPIKRHIKKLSLPLLILKDKLQGGNENFDISHVKKLILFVGPYRNLTTYMAGNLAVHPNCEVLNHAGIRVINNWKVNFLKAYSEEKYQNFLRFFNYAQQTGYKGVRGGNIIYSHAFDSNADLRERYKKSPQNGIKSCFVWKESHMVTNLLMENQNDLKKMMNENPFINFFFPVRNPLDCATSNINTGKYKWFSRVDKDLKNILKAIFSQYLFFLEINKDYPNRVLFLFEHEINESSIAGLVDFLGTEKQDTWQKDMLANYKLKKGYPYSKETIDWALEQCNMLFSDYPEFQIKLSKLIASSASN